MATYGTLGRFPKGIETSQIRFTGPIWQDYVVPGLSLRTGTAPPTLAEFRDGLFQYQFAGAGATVEQAFFTLHILHDIHPDYQPTFHVHWSHNIASGSYTADTQSAVWQIDYTVAKGYKEGTFAAPTTLTSTQLAGAQYVHHITPDDDMTITETLEPDMLILGRVYRDPAHASDDFAQEAFLLQVDMHYRIGQIGTPTRNRPFSRFGG